MTAQRLLGGRYEISDLLGYGGMAEVLRGRDTRLGRDIAVKVLRHDLARDNGFQARFRREAQNAAALSHPSIVAVYDTGDDPAPDGVALPYIVMEYVEGRTLREVLQSEGRLMPRRAMEITADICAALEFSHRNGIVHRDIKPGNVMLTPTGQVKVMDFGIARAMAQDASAMTQTSAVMGTAQYLSPEQARGEAVDARSDVYSTGCLLYELLVGEPPFTGDSPVAVAYQHVREDPIPPSELNPDIPADVDAVVLKAMAKNPANRYQSAAEMRADLVRAAAGRPVEATPVLVGADRTQAMTPQLPVADSTLLRRPPERQGRRRLWYAVLMLAVIGVFVLAAWLTSNLLSGPGKVEVPNVKGTAETVAVDQLERLGFKVKVKEVNQSDATLNQVVEQSPAGGVPLKIGSTVEISVDRGVKRVPVPSLVGSTHDEAVAALTNAGLLYSFVQVPSDEPKGEVIETTPAAGESVPIKTRITIKEADGLVDVPPVVGKTEDEARSILEAAGFLVNPVEVVTADKTPGTVIDQGTAKRLASGATVTIKVARAPEPPPPSPTPTPTPTPTIGPP